MQLSDPWLGWYSPVAQGKAMEEPCRQWWPLVGMKKVKEHQRSGTQFSRKLILNYVAQPFITHMSGK